MAKNISDSKPIACGGPVLRRTDEHVKANDQLIGYRSGDQHLRPRMFNVAQTTTPDDDPRWGKTPCDPDWPESHI